MKTILKTVVGSRLHGLHNESSDFDYRGIFKVDLIDILSPFKKQQNTSWIEGKEDDTNYEVINFLKMGVSGNPTVLEILWSNQIVENTNIGEWLIFHRQKLLDDKKVYMAHLGYSQNQIKKMDLYNPDPKRTPKTIVAYVRSLRQCVELLKTGDFNPVYEYPDRDFILEIKNDFKLSMIPAISKLMVDVRSEVEEAYSGLSELRVPNISWIEQFIEDVYLERFN